MHSSHMRALILALIAFLCVFDCVHCSNQASSFGIEWSIPFSDFSSLGATGGVHANISGHEDKIFICSVAPAATTIVTFDVNQLLTNRSTVPVISTNFDVGSNSPLLFQYSTSFDGKIYIEDNSGFLSLIDPANLNGNNQVSAVSNAIAIPANGPLLPLLRGSERYIVMVDLPTTYTMINDSHWSSSTVANPTRVYRMNLPQPLDDQANWKGSCSVNDTYGYFIGASTTKVYLFRVNAATGIPEPAMIFHEATLHIPVDNCVYNAESDTLYLGLVGTSFANPDVMTNSFLLRIQNLTELDTGSGIVYDETVKPLRSSPSSKRQNVLWSIDAAVVPNDGFVPYDLLVDEVGGQAILIGTESGPTAVTRINLASMASVAPTIYIEDGIGLNSAGIYYNDAFSSFGHRNLLVFARDLATKIALPSGCPDDCGESLSPPRGACLAGVCQCRTGFFGNNCSCLDSNCSTPIPVTTPSSTPSSTPSTPVTAPGSPSTPTPPALSPSGPSVPDASPLTDATPDIPSLNPSAPTAPVDDSSPTGSSSHLKNAFLFTALVCSFVLFTSS